MTNYSTWQLLYIVVMFIGIIWLVVVIHLNRCHFKNWEESLRDYDFGDAKDATKYRLMTEAKYYGTGYGMLFWKGPHD